MPDWVWCSLRRVLVAMTLSPIALAIGWALVEGLLRPRLIPHEDIDALAETVMREHPDDPEDWALLEEHSAWHRSRGHERALWQRVRREIRRRLSEETPPRRQRP